jgi:hypothetical protein
MITYKGIEYTSYPAAALAFAHDLVLDPTDLRGLEKSNDAVSLLELWAKEEFTKNNCYEVPSGITENQWRRLCRGAIMAICVAYRGNFEPLSIHVLAFAR